MTNLLLPPSTGIRGVHHHTQQTFSLFLIGSLITLIIEYKCNHLTSHSLRSSLSIHIVACDKMSSCEGWPKFHCIVSVLFYPRDSIGCLHCFHLLFFVNNIMETLVCKGLSEIRLLDMCPNWSARYDPLDGSY